LFNYDTELVQQEAAKMDQFINTETVVIELLLIASVVAILVRRIKIPYTVLLVIVGLLVTSQQSQKIVLTPELILLLFVPPLVFEAAFHLEIKQLREYFWPILILAVPGVLLTTVIVGFIVSSGAGFPIQTGLVFGALISATDPVAVVALFRSLGVPKRLSVVVEGESLFNDGTSIVVFNLMLAVALPGVVEAGHTTSQSLEFFKVVSDFLVVSVGGIALGSALGFLTSQFIARIDDYLIETTLTTTLAFGSYLVAEKFHVSGVLAVVSAGIICGNFGPKGMSPTTRIVLYNFWEYLAFVANSLIFLLIGFDINLNKIVDNIGIIVIAVVAVLASRVMVIYGLGWLVKIIRGTSNISLAYQHVLVWGGLRGAVSLALVLSLPANFEQRELLQIMAFGVVLFTLLGQGTSMQFLLKKLKLIERSDTTEEYERRYARLLTSRSARLKIEEMQNDGLISPKTSRQLRDEFDQQVKSSGESLQELLDREPQLQEEELKDTRNEAVRAQRGTLLNLQTSGVISEEVYIEMVGQIDQKLESDNEDITDVSDKNGAV
jgi:CPA1 family monovalent cation:H+ antiporter